MRLSRGARPVSRPPHQAGRVAANLVFAAGLVYALAGLAASFVPVGVFQAQLAEFSGSGQGADLIAVRYAQLVLHARIASALLLAAWAALLRYRLPLADWLDAQLEGWRKLSSARLHARVQHWVGGLRAAPAVAIGTLVVLLTGFGLRLVHIDRAVRHDEIWSYLDYARQPIYAIMGRFTDVNDHKLNTILEHFSTLMFGDAPPMIRLPAFLFGVALVPVTFGFARAVFDRGAALLAASLAACATPLIAYSVNARGYSAMALLFVALLWAGHGAIVYRRNALWGVVVGCSALGFYTNLAFAIPLAAAFLWFALLALATRRLVANCKAILAAGCGAVAVIVLLYMPMMVTIDWTQILNTPGIHAHSTISAALAVLPAFAARLLADWDGDTPGATSALAGLIGAALLLPGRYRRLLWTLAASIVAALALQIFVFKDTGPDRIWLPFLPVLLVMAAAAAMSVLRPVAALVSRLGGSAYTLAAALAVLVCALSWSLVPGSTLLRDSIETGYFPGAAHAAALLRDARRGDILAIPAVRADDVLYFTRGTGAVWRVLRTDGAIRFLRNDTQLRPAGAGVAPVVYLLVDKALPICVPDECRRIEEANIPLAQDEIVLSVDEDDFVLSRRSLAASG